MLTKFSVEGFKCFEKKLVFNLEQACNYEFSTEAVRNGVANKGIIYGFNGCGKSNLGLAIFDIVSHLTDNESQQGLFSPYYLCLDSKTKVAHFEYQFLFRGTLVVYQYKKSNFRALTYESLSIDGREVLKYDFQTNEGFVTIAGAEDLNLSGTESTSRSGEKSNISRVKYVAGRLLPTHEKENEIFHDFVHFVDTMLLFYSLDRNGYIGFKTGGDQIQTAIIRAGKVKEFESFLQESNVNMRLVAKEIDGDPTLVVKYKNSEAPFYRVASRGTKSLALFFYWYIVMEQASFVFMDEFDAFYHFELAEHIVRVLKKLPNTQIILTTHNTDLLSNDLLRPDCYFWMNEGCISPLCNLTEKELRKAHNLQKMFKAGAFHG